MGKSFHGPFRITGLDEIKLSRTGEIFVRFRDISGNIVGAILEPHAMQAIAREMEYVSAEAMAGNTETSPAPVPTHQEAVG
ncbi:hypothetical protein [Rhizobium halophytocola]|uniref:Uncharacterized protein n=1 Tax=Rhizobium halophytocola TaxID=735519 RepID=A0ABS4E5J8_9HYPH|nr:hypothetical protein [Rhizobium halophytocola]MBP1853198.1 hypothetical protein [Rhizobium halophytocola]